MELAAPKAGCGGGADAAGRWQELLQLGESLDAGRYDAD